MAGEPFVAETENWRAGERQGQTARDTHGRLESQGQAIDSGMNLRQNESI